jgi:hypothetical protein
VVLPASHKVSRASWYSGFRPVFMSFAYGTVTLCGFIFPDAYSARHLESFCRSSTPAHPLCVCSRCERCEVGGVINCLNRLSDFFYSHISLLISHFCHPHSGRAGLGSSAFARHYLRNHCCFLFLQVLRCFSSLRLPPYHYVFMAWYL